MTGFGANIECPYCGAAWFQQPAELMDLRAAVLAVALGIEQGTVSTAEAVERLRAAAFGSVPQTFETAATPVPVANEEEA